MIVNGPDVVGVTDVVGVAAVVIDDASVPPHAAQVTITAISRSFFMSMIL
jgi:hypothetical protein